MKLTITAVNDPKDSENPKNMDLTVTCRDKAGREHTITFTDHAQQDLLTAIVGSTPALSGTTPRRSLVPVGCQLEQTSHLRLGLKLFLTPQVAIHFALERPLAEVLQERLAAFEWPDVTKQ